MSSLPINLKQDFYSLFSLPARFQIDISLLEENYRVLQAQVHPDKSSHLSEAEKRLSVQWSTRVNEGYQTLRSPLARARYLLSLHGMDTQEESNTAMPVDFLMQQMEWREALEEARKSGDGAALDKLERGMQLAKLALEEELARDLDVTRDYASASGIVRKLKFLEKFAEEIGSAYDELDL